MIKLHSQSGQQQVLLAILWKLGMGKLFFGRNIVSTVDIFKTNIEEINANLFLWKDYIVHYQTVSCEVSSNYMETFTLNMGEHSDTKVIDLVDVYLIRKT